MHAYLNLNITEIQKCWSKNPLEFQKSLHAVEVYIYAILFPLSKCYILFFKKIFGQKKMRLDYRRLEFQVKMCILCFGRDLLTEGLLIWVWFGLILLWEWYQISHAVFEHQTLHGFSAEWFLRVYTGVWRHGNRDIIVDS